MPMYSTQCENCSQNEDRKLSFQEYDQIRKGELDLECSACGGASSVVFNPADVSFVLKDGESGGFVSKAMKENAYRKQRRSVMAQRERDHVRPNTLQPNYKGQVMGSWKEARDAAYQDTYARVKNEHGAKTATEAAQKSAGTYTQKVRKEA